MNEDAHRPMTVSDPSGSPAPGWSGAQAGFPSQALLVCPIMVNARRLLRLIESERSIDIEPGSRPPSVDALVRAVWWGTTGEPDPNGAPGPEVLPLPLSLLIEALVGIGAATRVSSRLDRSPSTQHWLAWGNGGRLYSALFRAYFSDRSWRSLDGEPPFPRVWDRVPNALRRMTCLEPAWYDTAHLLALLIPEGTFSEANDSLRALPPSVGSPPTAENLFVLRFLEPLVDFGLLDVRASGREWQPLSWRVQEVLLNTPDS